MLTLTLQPSEADLNHRDTYIADGVLVNNNYGDDFALIVGTQNLGKDSQSLFRAILRFDLTSLITATIVDATLTLTAAGGNITNETFSIHRLTQPDWTEFGATWNVYDLGRAWIFLGGDYDPTPVQSVSHTFIQNLVFNQIKPLVEDAIENRAGILDVLIKGAAESGLQRLDCYSSGNANPAFRPTLVVNYEHPVWCVETGDTAVWAVAVQDEGC
ncbi:MAG: DNRLRE domain-containing protein [Pirellulales bacterium]